MTDCVIYTMGFAGKGAGEFFPRLRDAGVKRVIDIRLNNVSQLAGFTKKRDLEYFLKEMVQIEYIHRPELAPTKDILDAYKKKEIDWGEYEIRFGRLMAERQVETLLTREELNRACLLCSESEAEQCHRRLVAEYFRNRWREVIIQHL